MTVSSRSVATSNAVKVALASIAVFLSVFLTHMTVIGSPVIPCDGALLAYCWTAEQIGTGLSWVFWHGLASLGLGWSFVVLPRHA